MKTLSIDIESFSDIDLGKCGVYKYAESPHAELLLFGYAIDGGDVQVIDIAQGEEIPTEILRALADEAVIKWAFNASFERVFLSIWLRRSYPQYFQSYSSDEDTVHNYLSPESWKCSMVWSAYMGLPLSLEGVGAVLGLSEQKLKEGKALIKYFCVPCKPTKTNGSRTRNLPQHDISKWATFKAYNRRDVEVEMAIQERLRKFPVPNFVWDEYHLDQEINDRGIAIDRKLVKHALAFDERSKSILVTKMQELTQLENPNSVQQMKQWLADNGLAMDSLGKKDVAAVLKTAPEPLRTVLLLRTQLAKSSVKKYQAMANAICDDGRARGMFIFYGANRTGRFAGRIIQLQNLPQNHMPDLAQARQLVREGNYDAMELLYDDVPDTLSQLIRTAFIPRDGMKFVVADFSAIEARVLSWLAKEAWRCNAFASGEDIYCSTASRMFGVPVVKHGVNGELRQKGKIAELACIAEGELVLTDSGLVPIEQVTKAHRLWDGQHWVSHDGVIYKGEREVIEYEGLRATPDHLVFVEGQQRPIQFGIAAACSAHLVQTGDGRRAIRLGKNNKPRKALDQAVESLLCINRMHRVWKYTMAGAIQADEWKIKGLSELLTAKTNSAVARPQTECGKAALRESQGCRISQLWGTRDKILISKCNTSRSVLNKDLWNSGQEHGNRPYRHQWGLCSGEPPICYPCGEQSKQTLHRAQLLFTEILALCEECSDSEAFAGIDEKRNNSRCQDCCFLQTEELENHKRKVRLYDIRNAGRYHRFTVSGRLVHNCGYGGSVGALKAMGALEMGLQEEELKPLVDSWREANPNIVRFWWAVDRCVKKAVKEKISTETHGIRCIYQSGMLFIRLPSGRCLSYVKPQMGVNRFGGESVTYEGISATKKWERIESYGPKFVENIVQAISRDILCYAMQTLRHCFIVGHVHDELIIECSKTVSVDAICEQMSRTPPWAEGLLLRADGYECDFYKKD